jgi:hypothetical protein
VFNIGLERTGDSLPLKPLALCRWITQMSSDKAARKWPPLIDLETERFSTTNSSINFDHLES